MKTLVRDHSAAITLVSEFDGDYEPITGEVVERAVSGFGPSMWFWNVVRALLSSGV